MVGNLVVENKNFQLLFVCLFTCLFVPHVLPISQKENGPVIIPKIFWNQGCDAVLNLAVEFLIWNFHIFHYTLLYTTSGRDSRLKSQLCPSHVFKVSSKLEQQSLSRKQLLLLSPLLLSGGQKCGVVCIFTPTAVLNSKPCIFAWNLVNATSLFRQNDQSVFLWRTG